MEYTITLPDTFTFKRAGHDMTLVMDYTPAVITAAVLEGLKSKIGDMASGAAMATYETQDGDRPAWNLLSKADKASFATSNAMNIAAMGLLLMEKGERSIRSHGWEVRQSAATGLSDLETAIAKILMVKMTFDKGTKMADKERAAYARFAALTPEQQDKATMLAEGATQRARAEAEALAELDF